MKINISKINFGGSTGGGGECKVQAKSVTITANGVETVKPDSGFNGMNQVQITTDVPVPAPKTEEKTVSIVSNGQTVVDKSADKDGMTKVTIDTNVPMPVEQENKTVIVDANGSKTILPDSGNDAMKKVTLDVQVGGKQRFKLSNGIRFKDIGAGFNPLDYDWSEITVFDDTFDSGGMKQSEVTIEIAQNFIEALKRDNPKIYVFCPFGLFTSTELFQTGELNLNGLDFSECYMMRLNGKFNWNLSGMSFPKLEFIGDYDSGNFTDQEINMTGASMPRLRKLKARYLIKGMDLSIANNLEELYAPIEYQDWSQYEFNNMIYVEGLHSPAKKITSYKLVRISYEYGGDINGVLDLSWIDFSKCAQMESICCNGQEKTITNIGPCRSPWIGYDVFCNCSNLETIDLSKWDLKYSYDEGGSMPLLKNCPKLKNVKFPKNLTNGIELRDSPLLTKESLLDLIANLYDFGPDAPKKQELVGYANMEKLTPEEIAVATNKGWNFES